MVIKWHLERDDINNDIISLGSTYSSNQKEIPKKNDLETKINKNTTRTTRTTLTRPTRTTKNTDEEGWTTTTPGKRKPKNTTTATSTESIITEIEGNIDQIESGTHNKISVKSQERQHKCNIPEMIRQTTCEEFKPRMLNIANAKGIGKERSTSNQDSTKESNKGTDNNNNNKNNNNNNNNKDSNNDKKGQENKDETNNNNKEHKEYRKEPIGGPNRGGRGGRGGRGKHNERKQKPRVEWETYNFAISFDPKKMKNKDPDAEFQAILLQIMKKSPGVIFHPTNDGMYPKPKSFSTIQGYPQTEAAYKDFFKVYENKGLTIYKIYLRATMQYDKLELRHSLLNYLKSNNLWMTSELISESVDKMIGFIN
jgi:hypothetical protein